MTEFIIHLCFAQILYFSHFPETMVPCLVYVQSRTKTDDPPRTPLVELPSFSVSFPQLQSIIPYSLTLTTFTYNIFHHLQMKRTCYGSSF